MRAWKVIGKYRIYDDDGNVSHTDIAITSTTGLPASYTERVLGDHSKKSDEELIKLAHEEHFKSEYSDRAMAESVQKIDELELQIKESKKLAIDLQSAIDEAKASTLENKQAVHDAVAELTGLIMGMMGATAPEEGAENEEYTE